MNNFNISNIDISVDTIDCIENIEYENNQRQYLLKPIDITKSHTLVLDIDETLLSVRRWIDETQINDYLFYNKLNKNLKVIKCTKEVTLQYDDGIINVYSFYFNQQQPFGQLNSSLDVGDRMDIGGRLASVKEVLTSYITIFDQENNKEIEINCLNDDYLTELKYTDNKHEENNKFSKPDLVYNNMYLVRFRSGLDKFFDAMTSYNNLEIILWTAAVRKVYTGLMQQVHQILINRINNNNHNNNKQINKIWDDILFRDNCTMRDNGSYFKDLSLLNRNYNNLIMIDNISFNFQGFEYNGLPIQEYWGHLNDLELNKLVSIMNDILAPSPSNYDVRNVLHQYAFFYQFSTYKLDLMLNYLKNNASSSLPSSSLPSSSSSSSSSSTYEESQDIDIKPPPTPVFDQDNEVEFDDIEFPSSQSNVVDSDINTTDSMPTSLESSATATTSTSTSNEDSDKHLDYYLFNLSPALKAELDIDFEHDDDHIFECDVDPTLLFNQSYN